MTTIKNNILIVFQIFWITLFKNLGVILTSKRRKGEEKVALLNSNIYFLFHSPFFKKKSNLPIYFSHLCIILFVFLFLLSFEKAESKFPIRKTRRKVLLGPLLEHTYKHVPQPLHVKQTQKTRATYLSPFFAEKDGTNLHVVKKNGRMDTFIEQKRRNWSVKSRRRPHM